MTEPLMNSAEAATNLVFLVGPRGSGKTTVGKRLSENLGWKFLDADAEIQRQQGKTITEIFELSGEEHFRDLETAFVLHCWNIINCVVSLGGGVIGRAENRAFLKNHGQVVYLSADTETLSERILQDPHSKSQRPKLKDAGQGEVRQQMIQLNKIRQPLYNEVANWKIDTSGKLVPQIVAEILDRIGGTFT